MMKLDRNPSESNAQFTPADFAGVLEHLPEGCPIVGGQAVSYWAERYGFRGSNQEAITSTDIDFWGDREALEVLARRLKMKPIFPHAYEMTVWVGAIPLEIKGKRSLADFLHIVPGLDILDPEQASLKQDFETSAGRRSLQVLSPVSLALTKLHSLRHFNQQDRQDEMHLKVCLRASQQFLADAIYGAGVRYVLWNIERLIYAHSLKPYRHLEEKYDFKILDVIPIERIREAASATAPPLEDHAKLVSFLERRWPQVQP